MPALTTYPVSPYTGWGETVATGSDVGILNQPFQYDGRDGVQRDETLGMDWMRARHYSPQQGQFIQADPLPPQPGTADSAYSYGANDPVNSVDPTGLSGSAGFLENDWDNYCKSQVKPRPKLCSAGYHANHVATIRALNAYTILVSQKWGPENTFRHMYWGALLIKGFRKVVPHHRLATAREYAATWTNLHEGDGFHCDKIASLNFLGSADSAVDCVNNGLGFDLGQQKYSKSESKLAGLVFAKMWHGGALVWYPRSNCGAPGGRDCGGDDGYNGLIAVSTCGEVPISEARRYRLGTCG